MLVFIFICLNVRLPGLNVPWKWFELTAFILGSSKKYSSLISYASKQESPVCSKCLHTQPHLTFKTTQWNVIVIYQVRSPKVRRASFYKYW